LQRGSRKTERGVTNIYSKKFDLFRVNTHKRGGRGRRAEEKSFSAALRLYVRSIVSSPEEIN
jgi:hypothetical protein